MKHSRILQIQIYLNIVIAIVMLTNYHTIKDWIYIGILIIVILINKFIKISQVVNIVFLPMIFVDQFGCFIDLLIKDLPKLTVILFWIYFVGTIFVLIPVVLVEYGKIEKPIFSLIASVWVTYMLSVIGSPLYLRTLSQASVLVGLNRSGIVYGLTTLVYGYIVLKKWGYKFSLNLNTAFFSKRKNMIVFLLLVGCTIYIVLCEVFSNMALNLQELLWSWDFSLINPFDSIYFREPWRVLFDAIDAGIGEETVRYINILILLMIFKNKNNQIAYAIVVSSILFALPHIGSAFAGEHRFSLLGTILQVINSFGFGCFMATLFLYSGKIWIPMIIHALNDFLVFSITPLGTNNAGIFYSEIGQVLKVLIFVFIWIIFAIITFTKNKDIIRNNVQILTRVQKTDLTISRSKL